MKHQTQVPPAYAQQPPAVAAQRDDAAGNDAEHNQAAPEPQLRRSNRRPRSVFEGHLRYFEQ